MKLVVGDIGILWEMAKENLLLNVPDLQVFVLESDWNQLTHACMLDLLPIKTIGVISFIDENDVFFSEVHRIRSRYGAGISVENCTVINFAAVHQLTLVASSAVVIKIAKQTKVRVRTAAEAKFSLLLEGNFNEFLNEPETKKGTKKVYVNRQ